MRVPADGKIRQIGQRRTAAFVIDFPNCGVAAENLRHFDIKQVRRVQCLRCIEKTPFHRFRSWRAKQDFQQCRCVNDDHCRSRSMRTASLGVMEGTTGRRRAKRARSSSKVGRFATSRISLNK